MLPLNGVKKPVRLDIIFFNQLFLSTSNTKYLICQCTKKDNKQTI